MGILYPISRHINDQLSPYKSGKKPEWAMTEISKRALRYALAYGKNSELIAEMNNQSFVKSYQ